MNIYKYNKYKNKYNKLKKELIGGAPTILTICEEIIDNNFIIELFGLQIETSTHIQPTDITDEYIEENKSKIDYIFIKACKKLTKVFIQRILPMLKLHTGVLYVEDNSRVIEELKRDLPSYGFKLLLTGQEYELLIDKIFNKEKTPTINAIIKDNYELLLGLIDEYELNNENPDYIVKYNDGEYEILKIYINPKNGKKFYAHSITFSIKNKKTLGIEMISSYALSGTETIKKFEKFAKDNSILYIELIDASSISSKKCNTSISLRLLNILSSGQTWYNKLGYKYDIYNNYDKILYDKYLGILSTNINKFFSDYINKFQLKDDYISSTYKLLFDNYTKSLVSSTVKDFFTYLKEISNNKKDEDCEKLKLIQELLKELEINKYILVPLGELIKVL